MPQTTNYEYPKTEQSTFWNFSNSDKTDTQQANQNAGNANNGSQIVDLFGFLFSQTPQIIGSVTGNITDTQSVIAQAQAQAQVEQAKIAANRQLLFVVIALFAFIALVYIWKKS